MFIIGFWLAMTGLLVIRELYPNATDLNAIPVGHVGRLMFQHEDASGLEIYDKDTNVGYVRIEPTWTKDRRFRLLKMHGNVGLKLPGVAQRISWIGSVQFDATFGVMRLDMNLSTGEPSHQLDIAFDAATNVVKYTVRSGGTEYLKNEFTLDQKGLADLLGQVGFGPEFLAQFHSKQAQTPPPEFTAVQSSVDLNGETISTFLVSMRLGGQTLWEAHVSQLGQLMKARAPIFGYKLLPSGVRP